MKRSIKLTYILLLFGLIFVGCKQTRFVPEGKYLLKKNIIKVQGGKLDTDEINEIIRQNPNFKTLGFKLKLTAYNMVDSTAVAEKRIKKNTKLRFENNKRRAKQDRINKKRIEKARAKGDSLYTQKIIPLKDTVKPKMFFREWFKYKMGEKPVVFDSIPFNKSIEQLGVYLRNKGYYYGEVKDTVEYKANRKVNVTYELITGAQYIIDSVQVISSNSTVTDTYNQFKKKNPDDELVGRPFDRDYLNSYRSKVARFMRDNALYGFSSSNIIMEADTFSLEPMSLILKVEFTDRMIQSEFDKDSLIPVKHRITYVRNVYFHIADSINCDEKFYKRLNGLDPKEDQFIRTFDTLQYAPNIIDKKTGLPDVKRQATFLYNCDLFIKPGLIELQNYLEKDNYYKEYYLERSYTRLLQLELFSVIKPDIIENKGTNTIDVHYKLVPAQRQSFGFEPRMTNSNGFLGVASTVNYTNKNLFGGGQKLTFAISGGFESQPPVFDETLDGQKIKKAGRSFNTFELGPSIKLEIPGLFPTRPTLLSKRQRPRTVISTAYNYQLRTDFTRHNFQLNYLYRFYGAKTQIFQVGLPGASVIKYVLINKSDAFQQKLDLLNDLFLKNSYSSQLIWQDIRLSWEYNNKDKDDPFTKMSVYSNNTFDMAGMMLSAFRHSQDQDTNGHYQIFGVRYSQFWRVDSDNIFSRKLTKKTSLHARGQLGFGFPTGNTNTSLPYDYSFFAGGANDNRGWRARALGPGSYKYYLDATRTATQIGDMRIGTSLEYRFSLGGIFKGAVFTDAGNVWTMKNDIHRVGSQFSFKSFYREIALSAGVGLRMDLDFFILRLDFGMPLTNPALPQGEKWIFQDKDQFNQECLNAFGPTYKSLVPKPYIPNFHFGIGYPF